MLVQASPNRSAGLAVRAWRRPAAAPLPQPPAMLLNTHGQIELFEDWLFNDNGKFQLREFASPQAQTID